LLTKIYFESGLQNSSGVPNSAMRWRPLPPCLDLWAAACVSGPVTRQMPCCGVVESW